MPSAILFPLLAAAAQSAVVPTPPAPVAIAFNAALPRTSPAVIERSNADIVVNADGTFIGTRDLVVRIDREEAIRGTSTIPIPVSRSLQKFELVEAWTETPDHKRLPVSPDSVLTQAPPYAAQLQTLSDIELKVVNFPAVVVGSRIHIITRVTQTTPNFPNAYMLDQAPGHSTPITDGVVKLSVPRDMKLKVDADGFNGGQPKDAKDRKLYEWHYAVADYRPPQPGDLGNLDQSPRLIVTSMDDWAALARAYQSRADSAEKPSPMIRQLADKITGKATDDRERVRLLARWVAMNIRYVNIVLGVGGFVPDTADMVLQTRYGDCKGHATILNALLAAKGIDSTSVLINSTPIYREPAVAGQVFNHMINYVPSLDMFFDTTDPFALFGDLPIADRGKFVLLTRSGQTRRTPVAGPQPDTMSSETVATIRPDGGIDGTTHVVPTGSYIGALRMLSVAGRNQEPARIASGLMAKNGSPGSGAITLPNPDGVDASIVLDASWHLDDATSVDGTGALRIPYPMVLESIGAVAAGASGPLPTQPVTCGAIALSERTVVNFPPSMTILAVPNPTKVESAELTYRSDYKRDGQTVTVSRSYQSHYPGRTCSPATIASAQVAKRQIARDIGAQIVYQSKAADAKPAA